jgi:hypothetical protein
MAIFAPFEPLQKCRGKQLFFWTSRAVYYRILKSEKPDKGIGRPTAPPNHILIPKDEIKQKRRQLL